MFMRGFLMGLILAILLPVLGIFAAIPILIILVVALAVGPLMLVAYLFFPNIFLAELLKFGFGLFLGVLVGLVVLFVVGLSWLVFGAAVAPGVRRWD